MADVLSTADTTVGSGAFNRRVTIQQETSTPDGQGGSTPTWGTLVTTWAHVEPWKGAVAFQAQQKFPTKWIRILLRYRPSTNISTAMRAVYKDQTYEIRSITDPAEAHTTIELLCEELRAKGSL